MAGLNDDVEEGLISLEDETDLTIVDDVLTNQTNPSQPEPDKVLFTRKDSIDDITQRDVSITEIFGNGLIPGELPNLNAEFELIEQRRNTINDYQETSKIITGKNTISQEDARLLDSIVPGFINDNRPLEYFTKDNTRTYFNESVIAMKNVISLEQSNLDDLISNHLNNLSQRYSTLITGFDTKLKSVLVEQTNSIKNLLENEIIFRSDVSDNFLKEKIGLTDFLNISIDDLDTNSVMDNDNVAKILLNIKETFKVNDIRKYFSSFKYNSNGSFVLSSNENFEHNEISLNTLFNIHKGSSQEKLPFDIYLKLKENEMIINNIRNCHNRHVDLDSIYNTPEIIRSDIILLTKDFNSINNLSKNLYLLNIELIKFLELFKY